MVERLGFYEFDFGGFADLMFEADVVLYLPKLIWLRGEGFVAGNKSNEKCECAKYK